jgi:hypothetical protein
MHCGMAAESVWCVPLRVRALASGVPNNKAALVENGHSATSSQQQRHAWTRPGTASTMLICSYDRVSPEPLVVNNLAAAGAEAADARKGVACIAKSPQSAQCPILVSDSQA